MRILVELNCKIIFHNNYFNLKAKIVINQNKIKVKLILCLKILINKTRMIIFKSYIIINKMI